jgi:hypothetical protein
MSTTRVERDHGCGVMEWAQPPCSEKVLYMRRRCRAGIDTCDLWSAAQSSARSRRPKDLQTCRPNSRIRT